MLARRHRVGRSVLDRFQIGFLREYQDFCWTHPKAAQLFVKMRKWHKRKAELCAKLKLSDNEDEMNHMTDFFGGGLHLRQVDSPLASINKELETFEDANAYLLFHDLNRLAVDACERIARKQNPKKIAPRFFEKNHAAFKPVLNNLLKPGISTMQIAGRLDKYFEMSLRERHAFKPQYKVSPQTVDASVAKFLNVEVTPTTQLAAEKLQRKLRAQPEITDVLANYQDLLRCV